MAAPVGSFPKLWALKLADFRNRANPASRWKAYTLLEKPMKTALRYIAAYGLAGLVLLYALIIGLPIKLVQDGLAYLGAGITFLAKGIDRPRKFMYRQGMRLFRFAQSVHPKGKV